MIKYKYGDIINAEENIICHQVNCQGKMSSGVAKAIRKKWPKVYNEYIYIYKDCLSMGIDANSLLGTIQEVKTENKNIINMFSQGSYGYDHKLYTSYDSFIACLSQIAIMFDPQSETTTIAFPYKIASVRGGAHWRVIRTIIEEELKDYNVTFYCLNPREVDDEDKEKFENESRT